MSYQMTDIEEKTVDRLLDKSQEAFLLSVELYNRPTIRYHVEGCAFFLCNAWELMLKAYIIKERGERSVYYKDNGDRTINISRCVEIVMTNSDDPMRANLEKVIDIRNTSTHFVTDEYEIYYGPLLQVCVKNFDDKIRELHGIEVCDRIPEDYLVLSVRKGIVDPEKVRAKYSPEVAEKLLTMGNSLSVADGDPRYSGYYETSFVLTKNPEKADLAVRYSNDASAGISVVKEMQDFHNKYPFTTKIVINEVRKRLKRSGVTIRYKGDEKVFTSFQWNEFVKFYGIKTDQKYAYNRSTSRENPSYVYSQQAIELVVRELSMNPDHAIDELVAKNRKGSA